MKGIEKYEETRNRKRERRPRRERNERGKASGRIGNNPTPKNTPIVIPVLARFGS